jgi:hypothetical protein
VRKGSAFPISLTEDYARRGEAEPRLCEQGNKGSPTGKPEAFRTSGGRAAKLFGLFMKVFISWSGQRSAAVADALRYWLPKVIQALEPWMSADDIEKGTRWRSGLASELEESSIGIICLTRENLDSTWIHFEAGALSKQQHNTYVCTLLFGLEPTDVREPLAQFQHTRATKDDLRKLISTINKALGDAKLPESELSEGFEVWWPKLQKRLDVISPSMNERSEPVRQDREILDEILELVREQTREIKKSMSQIEDEPAVRGETLTPRTIRLIAKELGVSTKTVKMTYFRPSTLRRIRQKIRNQKKVQESDQGDLTISVQEKAESQLEASNENTNP